MAGIDLSSFFGGGNNYYSDYASIRNGSYKKLMKSYYAQYGSKASSKLGSGSSSRSGKNILDQILEEKRNPTVSKSVSNANSALNNGVANVKSAINTLQNESTYSDTDGKDVGDKINSALKSYVSSYNSAVKASKQSNNSSMTSHVAEMMNATRDNASKLKEIGISINGDGTLTLDETTAKKAKSYLAKDLFSSEDTRSYGSAVSMALTGAAYYTSRSNTTTKTKETSKTDDKSKDTAASGTDLKADIEALTGDKLFATTTEADADGKEVEKYDIDGITSRVSSFVKNYNDLIGSARLLGNEGVTSNLKAMLNKTSDKADSLKEIGITADKNGNLKLDEKKLKASDMAAAKKTLKSYASSIESNASLVKYYATTNANSSTGYTSTGSYNTNTNSGFSGII